MTAIAWMLPRLRSGVAVPGGSETDSRQKLRTAPGALRSGSATADACPEPGEMSSESSIGLECVPIVKTTPEFAEKPEPPKPPSRNTDVVPMMYGVVVVAPATGFVYAMTRAFVPALRVVSGVTAPVV